MTEREKLKDTNINDAGFSHDHRRAYLELIRLLARELARSILAENADAVRKRGGKTSSQ